MNEVALGSKSSWTLLVPSSIFRLQVFPKSEHGPTFPTDETLNLPLKHILIRDFTANIFRFF